jgi:putative DNA-binding protein
MAERVRPRDDRPKPDPREGGPRERLKKERASATPTRARVVGLGRVDSRGSAASADRKAASSGLAQPPLAEVQRWFSSVVTNPSSVEAGIEESAPLLGAFGVTCFEQIVTSGPALSAVERLGLYHYGYRARLVECLADDYPVLQHALGARAFEDLAHRYIEACPSEDANLNFFGRRFPSFCRGQGSWLARHEFAAELARLEWAMVEVFHAEAAPVLTLGALQEVSVGAWASVKLPPSPTLRIEEMTYPVNRYLQAVREERDVAIPKREWSATAIYRQAYTVWRMDLTKPMHRVLSALVGGATLGEALDVLAAATALGRDGRDASTDHVMIWFREWVEGGFFARIEHHRARGRTTAGRASKRSKKRKGNTSK